MSRSPRRAAISVALCAFALAAVPGIARAEDQVVVLEDSATPVVVETAALAQEHGFTADQQYDDVLDGFAADLDPQQVAALEADPAVEAVVPDRPIRIAATQSAIGWSSVPPGVRRVSGAANGQVRDAATGAVAVVDTGVDLDHPDLNVVSGYDCIGGDTVADDENGHGTHVAGIIGARNNGTGVTGVAPGTRIVAIRSLDASGSGTLSSIVCGLEKVRELAPTLGITVVNLSLGGGAGDSTCTSDPEHKALCRLAAAGVVPVVAAGNESADVAALPTGYDRLCPSRMSTCRVTPAIYPEVLTVAAMTETDGLPGTLGASCGGQRDGNAATAYSNFATRPEDGAHLVAAPGTCVRSTYPGGSYKSMSGTSMATPHVAALVALCDGEGGAAGPCSTLSTPQVIERMRLTGDAAGFNGIAGRDYGPLARYSEAAVELTAGASPTVEQDAPQTSTTPPPPVVTAPPAPAPAPPRPAPAIPRPIAATPPAHVTTTQPAATPTVRLAAARTTLAALRRTGLRVKVSGSAVRGTLRLTVSRATARRLGLRSTTLATVRVTKAGPVRLRVSSRVAKALTRSRGNVSAQLKFAHVTKSVTLRR